MIFVKLYSFKKERNLHTYSKNNPIFGIKVTTTEQSLGRTSSTTEKPIFRDNTPDETCKTVFGDSGICKAASTCAFRDSEDHAFSDCSNPSQICCKQL